MQFGSKFIGPSTLMIKQLIQNISNPVLLYGQTFHGGPLLEEGGPPRGESTTAVEPATLASSQQVVGSLGKIVELQ